MRGGTQWSTHSWGIAVDFDPARNRLRWGRDHAAFAHPIYNEWWRCWEEEGWVSLGRRRNFDWMHIQACGVNNGLSTETGQIKLPTDTVILTVVAGASQKVPCFQSIQMALIGPEVLFLKSMEYPI